MNAVFIVLTVQALMGAFDNLWHHELQARLPQRRSARHELALHAVREALYGLLFIGLAWVRWQGWWVLLPTAMLLAEVVVTAADFLEEDRSRRLPPFERVLHTLLAVSYGVLLGVLAPVFIDAARLPTGLALQGHGLWSWFMGLAGIVVLAWSLRNALALWQLHAQVAADDLPHRTGTGPAVLVTGGTGFIGSALVRQLVRAGRRVIVYTRDTVQARATFGPAVWVVDRLDDIPHETLIDAVVNLAGAPVLGAPWTAGRRRQLMDSRVQATRQVLALLHRLGQRPQVMVSASAVGYYGVPAHGAPLDESAPAEPGRFQSDLCTAIEHESRRAEALGVRVVSLRLGIVLGADGGAYGPLALAARVGLGAVLGSGRQPVPWIHRDDALGLICHAIGHAGLRGAVNGVAPDMVDQAAFAASMARSFGRRVYLRAPAWPLRRALGEMSELLLEGQRVVPTRALASGYRYRWPDLDQALRALAL